MKKLNETLRGKGGEFVWIGLDRGDTGKWRWSLPDGNAYTVEDTDQNWRSGEPDNRGGIEFCVSMFKQDGKWFDDNCESKHTFVCFDEHHTDLASVRNETERQQITAGGNGDNFWIGLFKDWKWSDQSSSLFRYWESNQPDTNDKCAAASVKDQGQWHDIKCGKQCPFICHESELY
uniref:C-type lectin domain-containing protein n=1 Tax=Astyanax mexicanus TaxID=7994 RepID=A0A3B1J2Y9_ASTMX